MANRQLLKKVKTVEELKVYQPSSEEYKEIIFEEIRLDVPILEVGSSSIGKSYSIRDFQQKCGVSGEFLFVGTEKSEFIEGIPNLKGVTESGAQKFTYLKPYWFPDASAIRKRLIAGRAQLNSLPAGLLSDLWKQSQTNYDALQTLKSELTKIRRDEASLKKAKEAKTEISKYVYSEGLAYISMIQGYGNFWLILDEIDKVEKQDKDKYAPLLHIVRERELKGWKLSGLRDYPEYDIKFVSTIDDRFTRLNKALDNPDIDITDTRIIGIANDLQVMEEESPALYRRFVKIIIDRSLYDENQFSAETSQMEEKVRQRLLEQDPGLSYQGKRNEFHSCIAIKEIWGKDKIVKDLMAEIEVEKTGNQLDELNLQWTLGFLPDLLFPGIDTSKQAAGKELFLPNLFVRNWNETEDPFKTYLYKIITDNFVPNYWIPLLECIDNLISYKKQADTTGGTLQEKALQMLRDGGLVPENYNKPDDNGVLLVLKRYDGLLRGIEDELKNLGPKAQKELIDKGYKADKDDLSGVTGSILLVAQENIQLGGYLMELSLNGDKKTVLTDKLMSSIPFIQNRLISSSPYISYTYSKDMLNYMNDSAIKLVRKTNPDKKFSAEKLEELSKKLFESMEVDKSLLTYFGCGLTPNDEVEIKALKLGGDTEKKAELLDKIFKNRPVIIYDGLVNKLNEEQKIKYYENLAPFKLIDKEVFSNLPKIMEMIAIQYQKDQQKAQGNYSLVGTLIEKDIKKYCAKFPNNMLMLSEADVIKKAADLYDLIQTDCKKAIADGTATEIDVINKFD